MGLSIDQVGIGRRRAAIVCGVTDATLTNWLGSRYGLFRDEPTPRPYVFSEIMSVRFLRDAIEYGLPVHQTLPTANQRSPWRALIEGRAQMRLVRDAAGRLIDIGHAEGDPDEPTLIWPVRPLVTKTWTRFAAAALDQARSPEEARALSAMLSETGDRLQKLLDTAT